MFRVTIVDAGISICQRDHSIRGIEKDYISLGITGSAGAFSYALAHKNANTAWLDGDDNSAKSQQATTGVRVSTTLGGATVALGYAKNDNGGSTGIEVSYPMGASINTLEKWLLNWKSRG